MEASVKARQRRKQEPAQLKMLRRRTQRLIGDRYDAMTKTVHDTFVVGTMKMSLVVLYGVGETIEHWSRSNVGFNECVDRKRDFSLR